MKSFPSLQSAIGFINALNIPESEIDFIEQHPQVFRPYDVRLKHADCDIIAVIPSFDKNLTPVYEVQKRYFGGPISLTESLGMMPNRYKTPTF
jgi:hypothetical protein